LIPNVPLTATNVAAPVAGPATSLLVYNTATAGAAPHNVWPGFYYWDGTQWVRLLSSGGGGGAGDAWLLAGNANTNPAIHFLGTTDNKPLRIRVDSQQTFQFNTNFSIQRDVGGNPRGTDAVDLQRVRSMVTQVASGGYSVIGGGHENTASGNFSVVVGGSSNVANGGYNLVFGEGVSPSVTETHRVYLFGDGSCAPNSCPSGRLAINRLNAQHPLHIGTNNANGNDAYLTAGGTWTNASSRSLKDRFRPLYPQEVLQKILAMRVEGWYYKGTEEYHIGPYAEDFYAAFGTGVANENDAQTHLAASDVAGVSLLGIQALHKENDSLRRRVSYLETENAALRARLDRLESLVEKIASTQANP
jgi:hypothetical protein